MSDLSVIDFSDFSTTITRQPQTSCSTTAIGMLEERLLLRRQYHYWFRRD